MTKVSNLIQIMILFTVLTLNSNCATKPMPMDSKEIGGSPEKVVDETSRKKSVDLADVDQALDNLVGKPIYVVVCAPFLVLSLIFPNAPIHD